MAFCRRFSALVAFLLFCFYYANAQTVTDLQKSLRALNETQPPAAAETLAKKILTDHKLNTADNSETIDMVNGTLAMVFIRNGDRDGFERYMEKISNPFNETSFLSMASSELIDSAKDIDFAEGLARRTIDLYENFKNDSTQRPVGFAKEDWQRFMDFAKYPYYDTYAKALFANGKFDSALIYQRLSFHAAPEEAIPGAMERYAKILEQVNQPDTAVSFLMKVAGKGRLNRSMAAQLHRLYQQTGSGDEALQRFIDSLKISIHASMVEELREKMDSTKAPNFSLRDLTNRRVRLSDFKGKIVVLDLWATWCIPCINSFPAMQKQVEKYPDIVFLFIAVEEKGKDPKSRVKSFMEKNPYTFQVLMDEPIGNTERYQVINSYKPTGIPAKYFIDKAGILRFQSQGFDTDEELINEMDAMFSILKQIE